MYNPARTSSSGRSSDRPSVAASADDRSDSPVCSPNPRSASRDNPASRPASLTIAIPTPCPQDKAPAHPSVARHRSCHHHVAKWCPTSSWVGLYKACGDHVGEHERQHRFGAQRVCLVVIGKSAPWAWRCTGSGVPRSRGGRLAAPRGHKAWGLLTYLLATYTAPSRSQLAGLLFAEAADPLRSLRWHLSELRRVLGVPAIGLGGDPVLLQLPAGTVVDIMLLPLRCVADSAGAARSGP